MSTIDKLREGLTDEQLIKISKTAKTHKGRKILEERKGQEIEPPKFSISMKGNKTSEVINDVLHVYNKLWNPQRSKHFNHKKNEIYPFDDVSRLEWICEKNNAALFAFGYTQKKRPNNLILGWMFNEKLLDMYEFGVTSVEKYDRIPTYERGITPVLLF